MQLKKQLAAGGCLLVLNHISGFNADICLLDPGVICKRTYCGTGSDRIYFILLTKILHYFTK